MVVGAGFPGFFRNAVRSVFTHTEDDVLGIYNSIDADDNPGSISSFDPPSGVGFELIVQPNGGASRKVGGLYGAYNLALEFARNRYHYVSFLQGDMQLLDWPKDACRKFDRVFSNSTSKVFAVSSSYPCRGAFDRGDGALPLQENVFLDSDFYFDSSKAGTDVGVYSMRLIERENFRFQDTEREVSARLHALGYGLARLVPAQQAFVPWPATVRKQRRIGSDLQLPADSLILKKHSSSRQKNMKSWVRWAEDVILPNGYRTLYPYWPTDTDDPKWIMRRKKVVESMGIGFFAGIDDQGVITSYFRPRGGIRYPSLSFVLKMLVASWSKGQARHLRGRLGFHWRRLLNWRGVRKWEK